MQLKRAMLIQQTLFLSAGRIGLGRRKLIFLFVHQINVLSKIQACDGIALILILFSSKD